MEQLVAHLKAENVRLTNKLDESLKNERVLWAALVQCKGAGEAGLVLLRLIKDGIDNNRQVTAELETPIESIEKALLAIDDATVLPELLIANG